MDFNNDFLNTGGSYNDYGNGQGYGFADGHADRQADAPTTQTETEPAAQAPDGGVHEDTADDTDTGKRTRKASVKVPKLTEDAAKAILDILDTLDDETAVRTARTILGTNSPSKATLLALTSEIKGRGIPKLEQATAKRIVDAVELLDTDTGIAVAKTLTGSNSPNRATLLSALTETKTRNHAATMFQHATKIGTWNADELMMNLALEFASDKDYAKSLFVVLDAAAPERGFGRSSGDARKDAKTIAEKWDGGVDLARFSALRF